MEYTFRCEACDTDQTVTDRTKNYFCYCTEPPTPMVRVYNFAGSVFKGSGFYKTDKRKG